MKILNFEEYLDGGSILITTNEGVYCFDNRIHSTTKGKLYNGYPKGNDSNIIENSIKIEKILISALNEYENSFYSSTINNLIKNILLKN